MGFGQHKLRLRLVCLGVWVALQFDRDCPHCSGCLCCQGLVSLSQVRWVIRVLGCPLSFIMTDRGPHHTVHWFSDRQAPPGYIPFYCSVYVCMLILSEKISGGQRDLILKQ